MLYTIIFIGEDRPSDMMWLTKPTVGDVLKINMFGDDELEYWDIAEVDGLVVTVHKL